MTNQKLYDPFRVSYNIFISPNFRLPTSNINIKQMLLNKRTTSENTRYPTKRLRTRLTFAQKKDVCVKLSSKPKPSQGELAEEYGVKQNTISDIWKNKEKWLAINSESKEFNRMSNRRPLFPQVEAALVTWITQALSDNQTLTGDILQLKARHFAQLLELKNLLHQTVGYVDLNKDFKYVNM